MHSIPRKPITNCPKCESASVYRSKRRGVAEMLLHRVLFISPYRCYDCDDRHYRFRLHTSTQSVFRTPRLPGAKRSAPTPFLDVETFRR